MTVSNEHELLSLMKSLGFERVGLADRRASRDFVRVWKARFERWLEHPTLVDGKARNEAQEWDQISETEVRFFLRGVSLGDAKGQVTVQRFKVTNWPSYRDMVSAFDSLGTAVFTNESMTWTLTYDDQGDIAGGTPIFVVIPGFGSRARIRS